MYGSAYGRDTDFSSIVGKTFSSIEVRGDDEILFTTTDGERYQMLHHQSCCENVYLAETIGDLQDLVGSPILSAEEVTQDQPDEYGDSMWTFYKLAGIKGNVTLRWVGSSNGYYSISVSFEKLEN
jgi:hypothetical protein